MTSTTRREILSLIKRRGPMTVQELSRSLEITPMGVRQHLAILERDGLIQSNGTRRGQGRPSRIYTITLEGDKVFPRTYEQVATSLLDDLKALGGEARVDEVLEFRRKRQLEQYRERMAGTDFPRRITVLAEIRNEEGYLAELQQPDKDTFVLTEHNCPVRAVADAHRRVCACERALFADALGGDVTRTDHILSGAPHCRYVITRSKEAGRRK